MITPKIGSANYTFQIDGDDRGGFERMLEREFDDTSKETLCEKLESLSWIDEVDYGSHFGHVVYVEGIEDPSIPRLTEIVNIIAKHIEQFRPKQQQEK